jgi:hypothetical protein
MSEHLVNAVSILGGPAPVANLCDVSRPAVDKWLRKGRLPRTEWTGETDYASKIAAKCRIVDPESKITREALLGLPNADQHARRAGDST